MLLGHVLEADGDTAAQHVLGDDEDTKDARCRNAVRAIWKVKEERMKENEVSAKSFLFVKGGVKRSIGKAIPRCNQEEG